MLPRSLRRIVALAAVSGLPAIFAVACSQSTSHPPISGDCIGELCPPVGVQKRPEGNGGGEGGTVSEGGTVNEGGTGDAGGGGEGGNLDATVLPDVAID